MATKVVVVVIVVVVVVVISGFPEIVHRSLELGPEPGALLG